MIILNSPIKNGRLQLGIFAEGAGNVFLYAYNISGELVYREMLSVSAGPNVFDREFKKARGVYILRAVLKTTAGTKKMPLNKFAVVRNDY